LPRKDGDRKYYQIDRGYEKIEERLRRIGADIKEYKIKRDLK